MADDVTWMPDSCTRLTNSSSFSISALTSDCDQSDFVVARDQAFGQIALACGNFMQLLAHVAQRMRHGARHSPSDEHRTQQAE